MIRKLKLSQKILVSLLLCPHIAQAQPVQLDNTDHWYDVVSFSGNWDEAKDHASTKIWNGLQGHLATPLTIPQIQLISNLTALIHCESDVICKQQNRSGFWLGLYQDANAASPTSSWRSITISRGEGLASIEAWNSGEPNDWNGIDENRVALTLGSLTTPPVPGVPYCASEIPDFSGYSWWNDVSGTAVLNSYVIEYDNSGRVKWKFENGGNGHWYGLVSAPDLTWEEAQLEANSLSWQGMRGNLATITSEAELKFISEFFGNLISGAPCTASVGGFSSMLVYEYEYWAGATFDTADGWQWITDEAWLFNRLNDNSELDSASAASGFLKVSSNGNSWSLSDGGVSSPESNYLAKGYIIEFAPGNENNISVQEIYFELGRQACMEDPASCDIAFACAEGDLAVFDLGSGVLTIPFVQVLDPDPTNASARIFSSVTMRTAPECSDSAFEPTGATAADN